MNELSIPIYITRSGQRFGPYTLRECQEMIETGQLLPSDMAWRHGMPNWLPLSSFVPMNAKLYLAPVTVATEPSPLDRQPSDEETVAELIGQMGCGCVLWIGLLVLALGGGVIFPLLLILLPIALIGGIVDMVKKIVRLVKRVSKNGDLR
ncbi:MAG: DUF4339 domain-containing protein [Acidobacteriota bacterium]